MSIRNAEGKTAKEMALADASTTPAASGGTTVEGSGQDTSQGQVGGTSVAGTPEGGGAGGGSPAAREMFFVIEGKKFKAEVGPDGTITSKDLQPILDNPRKFYESHSTAVRERQMVRERERIRNEEQAGLREEIRALKEALAARPIQQGAPAAQGAAQAAADEDPWANVDPNDPTSFIRALSKDNETRDQKIQKAILDRTQERDRYMAQKSLMEAYDSWKDYDESLFGRILRDEGVAFTKDGPDYDRMKPWEVESVARESLKTLAGLKALDARADGAIARAVSLMPAEFDEDMLSAVEQGFRAEMARGRPTDKQEDCDLIAYEVAQKVLEKDSQRIVDRAAKYRAAFEKNKGGTEKVKTDVVVPPEKSGEMKDLSREERHARIRREALRS